MSPKDFTIGNPLGTYEIRKTPHTLPFEITYEACDVKTKSMVRVLSGEMVHIMVDEISHRIYVSEEAYLEIQKIPLK